MTPNHRKFAMYFEDDGKAIGAAMRPPAEGPAPGERRLAAAILEDAIAILDKHALDPAPDRRRSYREAVDWITRTDPQHPFSFVRCCEYFDLDVSAARGALLRRVHETPASAAAPPAPRRVVVSPGQTIRRAAVEYLRELGRAASTMDIATALQGDGLSATTQVVYCELRRAQFVGLVRRLGAVWILTDWAADEPVRDVRLQGVGR